MLESVGDDLLLSNLSSVTSFDGFESLDSIGGTLNIYYNEALTDLYGLHNIVALQDDLVVAYNFSLEQLNGLESIVEVRDQILLFGNSILSDITALEDLAVDSLNHLRITSNDELSYCSIQSICTYLSDPEASSQISANSIDCNSVEEINIACIGVGVEEDVIESLSIYPNPSDGIIFIESDTFLNWRGPIHF